MEGGREGGREERQKDRQRGTKLAARQKDTQTEKEKEKEREANLGGASPERPSAHEFDECVQYTIAAWPPCRLTKNWYGERLVGSE